MTRRLALAALFSEAAGTYAEPDNQEPRLIYRVRPVYPKLAREARIEGIVQLGAEIGRLGTVVRLSLISGHPFLVKAAMDAVSQWRYEPGRYFGVPVGWNILISVPFSLGRGERSGPVVYV